MNAKQIQLGLYSGLAGGVVFGAMMGMMGMLPMVGALVGRATALAGFVVHLAISAAIGVSFAVFFRWLVRGVTSGILYGVSFGAIWWLLGPLTLMPLFMGMGLGVHWNAEAAARMLPSLFGHVLYGLVLGASYVLLRFRHEARLGARPREDHAASGQRAG